MEKKYNTLLNYLFLVIQNLLIFTILIAQSHNTKLPELKKPSVNFKRFCCFNNRKMQDCTGCRCQCFGSGGTAGLASVRRDPGLSVPYPSKIDPPQGTVEPISKAEPISSWWLLWKNIHQEGQEMAERKRRRKQKE